jgi:D-methionine transport system ATP-binding protein
MIEFINVEKKYIDKKNTFHVLKNINLKINDGDIVGIIGKSGAGKSTLLRCTNLIEKPTSGQILLNGIDLTSISLDHLRQQRKKMGMIFQNFNLLNQENVYNNIALPLKAYGYSKKEIAEKVYSLIKVTELENKIFNYPDELSGGQKQRVAIARALSTNPNILLCDEPTSALDPETTRSILNLLKKINKELNVTILLITHQLEIINQLCNKVIILEDGCVVNYRKVA